MVKSEIVCACVALAASCRALWAWPPHVRTFHRVHTAPPPPFDAARQGPPRSLHEAAAQGDTAEVLSMIDAVPPDTLHPKSVRAAVAPRVCVARPVADTAVHVRGCGYSECRPCTLQQPQVMRSVLSSLLREGTT